ncbi:3-hydroxyacyl-CoA dehydrogenase NAD-binding domain-containing protein [Botrimarina mediterranea]|uniref:enoyl-CoA hydratase n=1 Tax=Botrimarina mediterranea TaxID=2528022 RepID=A0A518K329_9BACT|nr:3-hydroxyacyl-CoA dehydrogenase NAD-binding domain-containing protein [Botrimarina mediterranea]QDV72204.1 Fatty acid oxidation complex subunit alpha [Botrimarina mediterranea]QDV76747.1 Fatty acid oxidation complex subunit alpha [Planctomycetes bacterium K2D]
MTATRLDWTDTEAGRVAVVTLDLPGKSANLLSSAMLDEIAQRLDEVDAADNVAGLVITSAKPGVFIAGADLTEFAAGLDRPAEDILATCERGQTLLGRLASCNYVTVAAIDGVCVGGGLELAVWCDRRVVTDSPKTQLGFPEVKLGLMPGWGGTARTPRMIGLANAVELVTGGESVGGRDAFRLGLADDVVDAKLDVGSGKWEKLSGIPLPTSYFPLLAAAVRLIEAEQLSDAWRADREKRSSAIALSETELMFLGATAAAVIQQQTKGHYPAPVAALEVMLEASQMDFDGALTAEREAFAPLFGSPINRALLNVFFLTDRAKKSGQSAEGSRQKEASPRRPELETQSGEEVAIAGVIGAGIMGQGIAAANLKRGVRVLMSDNRPAALAAGIEGVIREASYDKATKGVSADLAIARAAHISGVNGSAGLAESNVVIEAVVENADVKRKLFAEIERTLSDSAILASNTSTIPITTLAEGLKRPENFAGLHFFNPVRKMPLVEVIRGAKTADKTVERLVAYSRKLGKTPVVVNDGPGFLVNRLLMPYMNEAALLVSEGVSIKAIDRAAKEFGMPMGPLELHDVVGLDTCLHAGEVLHAALGDRIEPAAIVGKLVEADRLGQKNGKGFYDWTPGKGGKPPKGTPSGEVLRIGDCGLRNEADGNSQSEIQNPQSLIDRLLFPMLLEATRALEEGIVDDARDVDLALILGVGFPPHRGGLFFWADSVGAAKLVERLEPLQPLGKRFSPTQLLLEKAKESGKFYG